MIDKTIVEKFLTANGLDASAKDEEIKSVLFSAKWHADDVETALMVLRENLQTHKKRVDSLHKVFHSDDRLKPETISALLGIDVDIPHDPVRAKALRARVSHKDMFVIAITSAGGAALCIVITMWYLRIGIFYGI